jgi:hypothetical protein
MRAADRECHHLLQFRYSVPATGEIRGEPELKSPALDQEDVAGGLAAHPLERPRYLLCNGQAIDLDTIVAGLVLE